jgi:hypothetical protein
LHKPRQRENERARPKASIPCRLWHFLIAQRALLRRPQELKSRRRKQNERIDGLFAPITAAAEGLLRVVRENRPGFCPGL